MECPYLDGFSRCRGPHPAIITSTHYRQQATKPGGCAESALRKNSSGSCGAEHPGKIMATLVHLTGHQSDMPIFTGHSRRHNRFAAMQMSGDPAGKVHRCQWHHLGPEDQNTGLAVKFVDETKTSLHSDLSSQQFPIVLMIRLGG